MFVISYNKPRGNELVFIECDKFNETNSNEYAFRGVKKYIVHNTSFGLGGDLKSRLSILYSETTRDYLTSFNNVVLARKEFIKILTESCYADMSSLIVDLFDEQIYTKLKIDCMQWLLE